MPRLDREAERVAEHFDEELLAELAEKAAPLDLCAWCWGVDVRSVGLEVHELEHPPYEDMAGRCCAICGEELTALDDDVWVD